MAGITTTFSGFLQDTGPNWQSPADERVNAVARLNYDTLGFLSRGKSMSRILRGGSSFQDEILLSITPRAHNISILDQETPAITESGVVMTQYWRLMRTHYAWDDRVLALNARGDGFQTYKNIRQSMMQEVYTDWANHMDNNLWRQPDFEEMEGATAKHPISIPALVNEHTNGIIPASTGDTLWTTVQGLATSTTGFSNFAPQRKTYANLTVADSSNLIAAFDYMFFALNFKAPPTNKEYFDKDSGMLPAQKFIACSKEGAVRLKQMCRNSQDRWSNPLDAYGGRETYAGVPVVPVAILTDAAIYPTGAAGVFSTEFDTAGTLNSGPRFYLLDSNCLDVVFHDEYFMKASNIQEQYGNPSRKALYWETMGNMWCKSRRNHGIIYPSADIA